MSAPAPSVEIAKDALAILVLLADRKYGRARQPPLVHRLDDVDRSTTTPMSESNDTDDETYEYVTIAEANNADVRAVLVGDDGAQKAVSPEVYDGKPMRVLRWYEPVKTVELPEPMTETEFQKRLSAKARGEDVNLPELPAYDLERYRFREALDQAVAERLVFNKTISGISKELLEIDASTTDAQERLDKLEEKVNVTATDLNAVQVDEVEKPEQVKA